MSVFGVGLCGESHGENDIIRESLEGPSGQRFNHSLQGGGDVAPNATRQPRYRDAPVPPPLQNTNSIRRYVQGGGDVETDATQTGRDCDAPGQSCVYVPPGDHRDEFYRLGTFGRFPTDVPVKVTDLAAGGFYYTGFKDRVKCFSCGMAVENWIVGDDGLDKRWHRSDCPLSNGYEVENAALLTPNFHTLLRDFKGLVNPAYISGNGTSCGNQAAAALPRTGPISSGVPMDVTDRLASNMSRVRVSEQTYPILTLGNVISQEHEDYLRRMNLRNEAERRKTFAKWPSYPAPYLVSGLAKEGFFYLGNLDRAQCFSCSGVLRNWASHDDVREQHQKYFPDCRIVQGMDAGNILMSESERQHADRKYQETMDRLNTGHDEPSNPSPDEQRRLANCFPCQNPVNPHMLSLQRRIETFDRRWPNARIRASVEQIAKAGFFFLGEGDKAKCFYCNGGLQNWDPTDEPWTEHAKWFPGCEYILRQKGVQFVKRLVEAHPNLNRPYIRNPASYNDIPPSDVQCTSPPQSMVPETQSRSSINITRVANMGFPREMIDRFIQERESRGGYTNTEELIDDLVENGDAPPSERNHVAPQQAAGHVQTTAVATYAGMKRRGQPEYYTTVKNARLSSPGASQAVEGSDPVQGMDAGNILMSDSERQRAGREYQETLNQHNEPPNPSPDEQRRLAQCFPCLNPCNLHMSPLQRRIETFDGSWSKGRRASAEQVAKAGFYFLDEGDKTECFYCMGVLQNWGPTDEPWTEHAKWFPGCEYLLRQKGVQFVKRNRPYIRCPASYNDNH